MRKSLLLSLFILLALLGLTGLFYFQQMKAPLFEKDISIYLSKDANYADLEAQLKENNLILDPWLFDKLAERMNLKNQIHGGHYLLPKGINTLDLIRKFRSGLQSPVKVVLNNVNFKADLAKRLSEQLEIDSSTISNFLVDSIALANYGFTKDNVLCYFIPNTYEFYWNVSLENLISRMKKEHAAFWNENRTAKAKEKGLTPNEAFILASIVEKEYKHGNERSKIAGVYVNRLKKGMILQADPTVKYALGNLSIKRVLKIHTEYDHPYNTYAYNGLPPGPICLPETSTIEAVLNAENHDYLYFCAKADMSGYHEFNKTYTAHINSAKLYHQALNKLKVY